jgi:hypothetical protein
VKAHQAVLPIITMRSGPGGVTFAPDAWGYLELEATIAASSGICVVRLDGAAIIAFTGNLRGRRLDFMELLPEEGERDMWASLKLGREAGYPCMLMPGHVPTIDGRDPEGVAFAYAYGYITGLLQLLEAGHGG